jgi:hypothetical protein
MAYMFQKWAAESRSAIVVLLLREQLCGIYISKRCCLIVLATVVPIVRIYISKRGPVLESYSGDHRHESRAIGTDVSSWRLLFSVEDVPYILQKVGAFDRYTTRGWILLSDGLLIGTIEEEKPSSSKRRIRP